MPKKIISYLKHSFPLSVSNAVSEDNLISLSVKKVQFYEVLLALKDEEKFDHLSDVTCIDYIDENEFELIYHLWSHAKKLRVNVKVRIARNSPSIKSVVDLWAGAQIHERENHEMFGINFEGNPNLSPLFLEDWEEIPPFRKDFDTRKYVREHDYGGD